MSKLSNSIEESCFVFRRRADFEVIYQDNFPTLYLHAFKMLGNREEAMDVVQEIFTVAWSKRSEITIKTNVKGYLFQAVKNKVLDIYARDATVRKFEVTIKESTYQVIDDEALREKKLMEQIEAEISTLPEQMALIFRMSRMEEKTHAEIAEVLDISVTTVKTHIGRALKKLRLKFTYFFF